MLNKYFGLREKGTSVRTETIAGLTTFLTMAYIIFVNPVILSTAGMDKQALIIVTCLVSGLITIATGLFGHAPIAMAPGMGLNAFLSYSLVLNGKITWQAALGVVFLSGLLCWLLTLLGLRKRLVEGVRRLCPQVQFNEAAEPHQLPGTVSATFPGKSGLSLLAGLDCYEVCVSIGSACTADRIEPSHVILGMGRDEGYALSTIRVSMGTGTTNSDVRYFLWALGKALRGDPEGFAYMPPEHLTRERILSPDTFLIDLRMRYERLLSPSIPGAKLWSHVGFEKHYREIPRDREVILMCTTGIFSFQAGYHLAMAGHPRVRVVYGGYAAWRALYPHLLEELPSEGSADARRG